MYWSFSLFFFSVKTMKSWKRRCQKPRNTPESPALLQRSIWRVLRGRDLPRSSRETGCLKTYMTVEGVPRAGSLISRCTCSGITT